MSKRTHALMSVASRKYESHLKQRMSGLDAILKAIDLEQRSIEKELKILTRYYASRDAMRPSKRSKKTKKPATLPSRKTKRVRR